MLVPAQAEQPEPQPPTAPSASAPSSTWKECPQPQDELAFGLLIANPAASMESTKSISAPFRSAALDGDAEDADVLLLCDQLLDLDSRGLGDGHQGQDSFLELHRDLIVATG